MNVNNEKAAKSDAAILDGNNCGDNEIKNVEITDFIDLTQIEESIPPRKRKVFGNLKITVQIDLTQEVIEYGPCRKQSKFNKTKANDLISQEIDLTQDEVVPECKLDNVFTEQPIDQETPQHRAQAAQCKDDSGGLYEQLLLLESGKHVPNAEEFECGVCLEECPVGGGVVLRACAHMFCRGCLAASINLSADVISSCPSTSCSGVIEEREVKSIITEEEYNAWLLRSPTAVENQNKEAFHCLTPDCGGWALCEGVATFQCPVCGRVSCIPCKAIHEGQTCADYQYTTNHANSAEEVKTRQYMENLVREKDSMKCPGCEVVITRIMGCDNVQCSACRTEICWATRGPRWGPGGRGDTSGGCRCGVQGKRCTKTCRNCH